MWVKRKTLLPAIRNWVVSGVFLTVSVGCSQARRPAEGAGGLSRKLTAFSYLGYGGEATVIVGTRAALRRVGTGYLPVEIAVANAGDDDLSLSLSSFGLVDPQGKRSQPVEAATLKQDYPYLEVDRGSLSELPPVAESQFQSYRRIPDRLTGSTSAPGMVRHAVELFERSYFTDFLYFREPATEEWASAPLRLVVRWGDPPDSAVVVFQVE